MTKADLIKEYESFTFGIPEPDKAEIDFLKKLPEGNFYIFRHWQDEADILFKSKFTKTIKSYNEYMNDSKEDFIVLKN